MSALLYKQFRLVCHPMTWVFVFFGAMLLIPAYPYTVAFFYVTLGLFFSFMQGREQRDTDFSALLPVRKRDTVYAATAFCAIVECAALVIAVPFAAIGVKINPHGGNPVGLDCNFALFAAALLIFAVFNAAFLPAFYRTGYKVGTSYLKAMIPTAVVMLLCEALPHFPTLQWLNDTTAAGNLKQLPLLLGALVIYFAALPLTARTAARRYEKVDL